MNNQEQIEKIIEPVIDKFIKYANENVTGLEFALNAFNAARAATATLSWREKPNPVKLSADAILNAYVNVPPNVTIINTNINNDKNDINYQKTKRRHLIKDLARENMLVQEFIRDLQILSGAQECKVSPPPEPPKSSHKSPDTIEVIAVVVVRPIPGAIRVTSFIVTPTKTK